MDYFVKAKSGAAIQAAIDEAAQNGGGRVVVSPGKYLSGTLYLKSNIELHVAPGAEIIGFDDPENYDDVNFPEGVYPEKSRKVLLTAIDCENIALTGSGTINGQGPKFYDQTKIIWNYFYAKPLLPRPRLVQFYHCRNVVMTDIELLDSPGWTCWLARCEEVRIARIRVTGCQKMINNDGIDIDGCRNVTISDAMLKTGDDCLVLRAQRFADGKPAICENVTVSNCLLDSACQGIRVGCPGDSIIRHCQFSNITISGRGNGIHCHNPYDYLNNGDDGFMDLSDVSFCNVDIECGWYPIRVFVEGNIRLRGIKRLSFENIRIRSVFPIELLGNPNTILEDISLRQVSGVIQNDTPIRTEFVRNLELDRIRISAETPQEQADSASKK